MLLSRRGWLVVTLLVLFLLGRSIAGTVIELKLTTDRLTTLRIVLLAVWIVTLGGVLFGLEVARFAAIISLTLGTAFSVTVLLDPAVFGRYARMEGYALWLDYLKIFAATNLVVVPLLAFSNPVRSYFSKMQRYRGAR